jgi:hypothetical protein
MRGGSRDKIARHEGSIRAGRRPARRRTGRGAGGGARLGEAVRCRAGRAWLAAVYAEGNQWFRRRQGVLVEGGPVGATAEPRPGNTILGLKGGPAGLLALGADQLILRLRRQDLGPGALHRPPGPPDAPDHYASVLHSSNTLRRQRPAGGLRTAGRPGPPARREVDRAGGARARAVEPARPAGPARSRPTPVRPLRLVLAAGRSRPAHLSRRAHLRDREGSRPRPPERSPAPAPTAGRPSPSAPGRSTCCARATCGDRARAAGPRSPPPSDLRAVAATPRCLFVASDRSVWKSCAPAPSPTPRRARSSPRR